MMKDLVQTLEPDRDDRDAQARRDHSDAGLEWLDFSPVRPFAFGEDQHGLTGSQQLPHVAQRLPGARFTLRQRERIEEQR